MDFSIQFPDPRNAEDDGLVAVGGELSTEYLLSAYSQGLFPWFNEGEPILWWSPNPRMVLYPERFKLSASLRQKIKSNKYRVAVDEAFDQVIENCASSKRRGQEGTWITSDMLDAYKELHRLGFAHSVETYKEGKVIGGLYGISIGKAFFGESMFHHEADASKIALYYLCELMKDWEYHFIDVQQSTSHLRSLGAEDIDRSQFLLDLEKALEFPTKKGTWILDEKGNQ